VHAGSASIAVTCMAAGAACSSAITAKVWMSAPTIRSASGSTAGRKVDNRSTYKLIITLYKVSPAGQHLDARGCVSLALGSPRTVYSIVWLNNTGGGQPTFYLDDIAFVDSGATRRPTPPPGSGPALSVDAGAARHAISPYIYGMSYADEAVADELRLPVRRWGGNSTRVTTGSSTIHNTGSDWYFETSRRNDAPSCCPTARPPTGLWSRTAAPGPRRC